MPFINRESWRPEGIDDLEPNAWKALRHEGNTCVIAGPGAGKTEFLAQRATYLLQTGRCPPPFQILAICFKKDAAKNLADRVNQRCPQDQARRFVSMTFDSFTKGIVDRFHRAIPEAWRPTRPYDIMFPKSRDFDDFLNRVLAEVKPSVWKRDAAALTSVNFEPHAVGGGRLPISRHSPESGTEFAVQLWWDENRGHRPRSRLTFIMINRLAELLLRANPQILRALRLTYPFVFLDEFQDATYAQYDFLLTAFQGSRTTLTAVGDDKQRIMVWAGARVDAFSRIASDFGAKKIPLTFNYRSSSELVRIQHVVAHALEAGTTRTESKVQRAIDGEAAQIWNFADEDAEASQIAHWVRRDMQQRKLGPRDYALLVRQKAERFEERLEPAFNQVGLRLRNEAKMVGKLSLQDLLAEDLSRMTLSLLRVCLEARAPDAWQASQGMVALTRGIDRDDEVGHQHIDKALASFRRKLRSIMRGTPNAANIAAKVIGEVFNFVDLQALARSVPQYSVGDQLAIAVEAIALHFQACAGQASTWTSCIDMFEGKGQLPLMTVHKSKGLEYDTMVFLGLDDDAWWSHSPNDQEGQSTFFVALSRAKQRAVFTYCRTRARKKVADLYQLLQQAGVREVRF